MICCRCEGSLGIASSKLVKIEHILLDIATDVEIENYFFSNDYKTVSLGNGFLNLYF